MNSNSTAKRDSIESLLNSEHIVEIEKMAVGGDGVARIAFAEKSVVVFIPKSAPADKLRIQITSVEKNFLNGKILEVLSPGPSRREPPCSYALRCGGCSWQQINDDEQINQKENLLKELFQKFLPNLNYQLQKTVRSPKTLHYRNRIQLKRRQNALGYFEDKSHDLVDIEFCLIADKKISDQIPSLKKSLKESPDITKYELKITQDGEFQYNRIGEKGEGLAFSQVNTEMNTLLVNATTELISRSQPQSITELYAGSGNFTFAYAQKMPATTIEAVELNSVLTTAAVKTATQLNLQKRLMFFTADCDSFVKRRPLSKHFVLLDPPRQGCSDEILRKLASQMPKNILYISCHPVSLARDLQKLQLDKSGYRIEHLQIFDMFPQTDHFETLIWLTR